MYDSYNDYYSAQVGGSIRGFTGTRFQRGHGFFGRLFSGIGSFIKDLAPSLLKRTLPSAVGLAQDVMAGENIGKSAKARLVEAGKSAADETLDKLKTRLQRGSGIPRRRIKKSRYVQFKKFIKKKKTKKKTKKKFKNRRKKFIKARRKLRKSKK